MQVLAAIGVVFAAWVVVGGACLGWGAALLRLMLPRSTATPGPAVLFWAGFAALLGLLQVWHLFLPVDWRATAVLLGTGWVAVFLTGAGRGFFAGRATGGGGLVLGALALWLAFRALDFPRNYDSGLYHFATIRWIGEFPAVPGLANLHERLGFNQSYFLFVALLNAQPFTNEGYHAANSLLCFALVAQLLGAAWPLRRDPAPAGPAALLACFLLPVVGAQGLGDLASPAPDFAVFAVGVATFLFAAQAVETRAPATLAVLPVLLAAGCTLKLSFVAFGAGLAAVLWWLAGAPGSPPGRAILLRRLALGGVAWGGPFAVHGIILSGYPFYPVTWFAWPADWRLPAAEAHASAQSILAWARAPGRPYQEVLASWDWLPAWCGHVAANGEVMLALLLAVGAGGALLLLRRRTAARLPAPTGWLFVPLLAGLGFWFFTAPDPRFALWLIWLLATWLLAGAAGCAPFARARLCATAGMGLSLALIPCGPPVWRQPVARGLHAFHRVPLREFVTNSGLTVFVPPADGDARLWDAPLPSSPYAKPGLELRGATLREGFRTAGDH